MWKRLNDRNLQKSAWRVSKFSGIGKGYTHISASWDLDTRDLSTARMFGVKRKSEVGVEQLSKDFLQSRDESSVS